MIEALRSSPATTGLPAATGPSPAAGGFGALIDQLRLGADPGAPATDARPLAPPAGEQAASAGDPLAERRAFDRLQQRRALPMRADPAPAPARSAATTAAGAPTAAAVQARAEDARPDAPTTGDPPPRDTGDTTGQPAASDTHAGAATPTAKRARPRAEDDPAHAPRETTPMADPTAAALAVTGLIAAAGLGSVPAEPTADGTPAEDATDVVPSSDAGAARAATATTDAPTADAPIDPAGAAQAQTPTSAEPDRTVALPWAAAANDAAPTSAPLAAAAGTTADAADPSGGAAARRAARDADTGAAARAAGDPATGPAAAASDAQATRTDAAPGASAPGPRSARPGPDGETPVAPGAAAILAAVAGAERSTPEGAAPHTDGPRDDLLASLAASTAAAAAMPAQAPAMTAADGASGAASAASAETRMTLAAALDTPAFPGEFADTIESLALQGIDQAELVVNPPELGPIRISMSMEADTLSIVFTSEHVETRQAIERSLPALQAALKEHGIELGDSRTGSGFDARSGDGSAAQRQAAGAPAAPGRTLDRDAGPMTESGAPPIAAPANTPQRRLLDLFA